MPVRLICMANSWREHGRCVAGIRRNTGEWIRPVPPDGGSLAKDDTVVDGRFIRPLDIVQMQLRQPSLSTRFQRENHEIIARKWELVGQADPAEVLRYCGQSHIVLHSHTKFVEPAAMEALPPNQWESLQLVHAENVLFTPDEGKDNRWVADFRLLHLHRRAPHYQITVTDPIATARLNQGHRIGRECLLTISLTEPIAFPAWELPERCYKVVAGVIELA